MIDTKNNSFDYVVGILGKIKDKGTTAKTGPTCSLSETIEYFPLEVFKAPQGSPPPEHYSTDLLYWELTNKVDLPALKPPGLQVHSFMYIQGP